MCPAPDRRKDRQPPLPFAAGDSPTQPRREEPQGGGRGFSGQSPWVQLRSANRHPFIFDRMILQADPAARPGDIVNMYDKLGQYFGRAMYNPRSRIVLRVLTHDDVAVDESFWQARLSSAIELRSRLRLDQTTDGYRLVHAEGDGLSGLIAERYADCLVLEIFSLGVFQRVEMLTRMLSQLLPLPASLDRPDRASPAWRVVVRADEAVQRIEGFRVGPAAEDPIQLTIREHGIRYRVDPAAGHKTGFFCDQRENRRRFADLCHDSEVLDLCCYTGGFSLCAKLLGRAREVTAVDLDEDAVAMARDNANLNQARVQFAHADAFVYVRQMIANGRQFDSVVLDPPKFATSRLEMEEALRKYYDLNTLAIQVVRPGGFFVTCSCSGLVSWDQFSDTVFMAARRARRPIQLLDSTGAGPDHPIMPTCPESGYLKALWLRVL